MTRHARKERYNINRVDTLRCDKCGKEFGFKNLLDDHMKSHEEAIDNEQEADDVHQSSMLSSVMPDLIMDTRRSINMRDK